jgi:hypothetical protein
MPLNNSTKLNCCHVALNKARPLDVLFSIIFKTFSNWNMGQKQAEHLKTMIPGGKIIVHM